VTLKHELMFALPSKLLFVRSLHGL